MNIGSEIKWRKDEFGKDAQALYLGELNVGHIMQYSKVGAHKPGQWRGWFNMDESGCSTGEYKTPEEARRSVENLLLTSIKFEKAE